MFKVFRQQLFDRLDLIIGELRDVRAVVDELELYPRRIDELDESGFFGEPIEGNRSRAGFKEFLEEETDLRELFVRKIDSRTSGAVDKSSHVDSPSCVGSTGSKPGDRNG